MTGKDGCGMTRREFLKTAGAGLAVGMVGGPDWLPAKEDVHLAVVSRAPAAATKKALEAMGGISRFVKKGQRVVLKPNMSFANPPDRASTTHPAVVVTVAQACLEAGAQRVMVLDYPLRKGDLCLERSGMLDAFQSLKGVHVLVLEERHTAGSADSFLSDFAELLQVDVTGNDINIGINNGHEGLAEVLLLQTRRAQQCAMGCLVVAFLDYLNAWLSLLPVPIGVGTKREPPCGWAALMFFE